MPTCSIFTPTVVDHLKENNRKSILNNIPSTTHTTPLQRSSVPSNLFYKGKEQDNKDDDTPQKEASSNKIENIVKDKKKSAMNGLSAIFSTSNIKEK